MRVENQDSLKICRETMRAIQVVYGSIRINLWKVRPHEDSKYLDSDGGYCGWVTSSKSAILWLMGHIPEDIIEDEL